MGKKSVSGQVAPDSSKVCKHKSAVLSKLGKQRTKP